MRHPGISALLLALATVPLAACSDDEAPLFGDVGPSAGHGGQGGAGTGGVSEGGGGADPQGSGGAASCVDLGEPCTACELAACPDVYCECYGNSACGLLAQCALSCPPNDAACVQQCATQHPQGITDAALLTDCAAVHCSSQCPGYQPLTPCQKCLYESCESAMNACIANPDCTALLYCLDACDADATCQNGCYAMYPGGLTEAYAVGTCSQASCTGSCG